MHVEEENNLSTLLLCKLSGLHCDLCRSGLTRIKHKTFINLTRSVAKFYYNAKSEETAKA